MANYLMHYAEGSESKNHKYATRFKKNGRWHYIYETDASRDLVGSLANQGDKDQSAYLDKYGRASKDSYLIYGKSGLSAYEANKANDEGNVSAYVNAAMQNDKDRENGNSAIESANEFKNILGIKVYDESKPRKEYKERMRNAHARRTGNSKPLTNSSHTSEKKKSVSTKLAESLLNGYGKVTENVSDTAEQVEKTLTKKAKKGKKKVDQLIAKAKAKAKSK